METVGNTSGAKQPKEEYRGLLDVFGAWKICLSAKQIPDETILRAAEDVLGKDLQ